MRNFILIFLAICSQASFAMAEKINYENTDHQTLLSLATEGDSEAQYQLGELYLLGENGVELNIPEAEKWYLKSADAGNSNAEYKLGTLYLSSRLHLDGRGIFKNTEKALTWLKKAAKNEHPEAVSELGHLYYQGTKITEPEKDKGLKLITAAAEMGVLRAMWTLKQVYHRNGNTEQEKRLFEKIKKTAIEKNGYWVDPMDSAPQNSAQTERVIITDPRDKKEYKELLYIEKRIDLKACQKEGFDETACMCYFSALYKEAEPLLTNIIKRHPEWIGKQLVYNEKNATGAIGNVSSIESYKTKIGQFSKKTCPQ